MFMTLKSLLHRLLLPPAGPLLIALAGAWFLRSRASARARNAGWLLLATGLAALWLLATPLVADTLARAAEREPALDLTTAVQAQAIVILGGGDERIAAPEYGGAAAPGPALLERLAYGAFVAHHTALPVLVSGTAREALAMRTSLARDFRIEVRWIEDQSRDTFENAQRASRVLKAAGVARILLVTDSAHEWRAAHEFASAGLAVVPAPVGVWAPRETGLLRYLPGPTALTRSSAALDELLGDLVRRALAALDLRRQGA
ncbi:MAG TPA: YdcF family protein [Steroidobacteraceae bacterium]